MESEKTNEQRRLIEDLERRVAELEAGLADKSRAALDRFEEGRSRIRGVEKALRRALEAGVSRSDAALSAIQNRGRSVHRVMLALEAETAREREVRDGPSAGAVLGRRAARREAEGCERALAILEGQPDADEALADLEAVRDSTIRAMVAVGAERDFFQSGQSWGEFQRALAAGLEGRAAELRERLEGEVLQRLGGMRAATVVKSILGSSRFVERKGRSPEDAEHARRLGLGSGISDEAERRLAAAEALMDEFLETLGDDSRSPDDRVAAYPEFRTRLQEIIQEALAEGLVLSQPAVMALRVKHQGIGVKLADLRP